MAALNSKISSGKGGSIRQGIDWASASVASAGGASSPRSFVRLVPLWLSHLEHRMYTAATRATYGTSLGLFVAWCHTREVHDADHVTRAVIECYQRHLFALRTGRGQSVRRIPVSAAESSADQAAGAKGLPLTAWSQRSRVRPIMRFYAWAVRNCHVGANPAADIDLPRLGQALPELLTRDDLTAVFAACDLSTALGVRDRAFMELLYATGLRRMEALNVEIEHLDLVRGLVQVIGGKGRKDRYVPTGQRALGWIVRYLTDVRPQWCRDGLNRRIFLNTCGQPISGTAIGLRVQRFIAKAGITKRGACHLFRHSFATHLLENGCDLRLIGSMLGHKDLSSTAIYTHTAVTALLQAHAAFHESCRTGSGEGIAGVEPDSSG